MRADFGSDWASTGFAAASTASDEAWEAARAHRAAGFFANLMKIPRAAMNMARAMVRFMDEN